MIEGLVGILNGVSPRLLKDGLASYAHIPILEIDEMYDAKAAEENGAVKSPEMRQQYES